MSKKLSAFCFACCLVVLTPVLAVNPDLQASTTGWSGQTVAISVHNSTTGALSARVRLDVVLNDGTHTTLTSPNFTVAGGTTISVSLSASQSLAEIEDDPEPIGIAE